MPWSGLSRSNLIFLTMPGYFWLKQAIQYHIWHIRPYTSAILAIIDHTGFYSYIRDILLHTLPVWGILVHTLPYMDIMIHIGYIVSYSATVVDTWPLINRNWPYSGRICHIGLFLVMLSQTRPHSLIFAHVRPNMNILDHSWLWSYTGYFLYLVIRRHTEPY